MEMHRQEIRYEENNLTHDWDWEEEKSGLKLKDYGTCNANNIRLSKVAHGELQAGVTGRGGGKWEGAECER